MLQQLTNVSIIYRMLIKDRLEPNLYLIALCAVLAAGVLIVTAGFVILVAVDQAPSIDSPHQSLGAWLDRLTGQREQQARAAAVAAAQRSDWASTILWLSELHAARPEDDRISVQLGMASFLYAQELLKSNQFEPALTQLRGARIILPAQQAVERSFQTITEYLIGRESYRRGDWHSAVQNLKAACDLDRDFKDVGDLLSRAQFAAALQHQRAGRLVEARLEYEALLRQNPGAMGIQARLAEIGPLLAPPKKRIVVSISRQRMYLYADKRLLRTWVCSTGEPGRDTKPGQYKVQTKMPLAYSRAYDLDMPYWLGIYYAGSTENGIHGPPIQRANGQKMWAGLIGYRVSFGCVILSDENIRFLYDWAPLGTPVEITR